MSATFEDIKKTGSLTSASPTLEINNEGAATAVFQLTGTWSGTVTFQAMVDEDGSPTWVAVKALKAGTTTYATTTTGTGIYYVAMGAVRSVRANFTTPTSGTVVTTARASAANYISFTESAGGGSAVSIADGADVAQGTTTDAGVTTDTTGTVIGFLRGNIIKWVSALTQIGIVTEAAPATDTASSGLNGRLQRIAQRITSLIALVPAALTGSGNFKVSVAESTATVTADTEITTAATDGDTFDIAATGLGKLGVVLHAMSAGGTLAGRVISHTSASDGRANTLNGLLVQNVPYIRNASNTNDAQRGANAGTGTTGTGVPCAAPMVWDGSTNYVRSRGDTSGFQQLNAGGSTATISATLTRPGNTTAYTANDEMTDTGGGILTLTSIATKSGGSGIITHVACSVSTNAATKPDLTLFFYDTTSTPATDNLAFPPSDGVQDTCIGYVRLTGTEVGDATSNTGNFMMDSGPIHIPFTCVGSANLFVRIKVNNAYQAGANSDTYKIRVKALQDY